MPNFLDATDDLANSGIKNVIGLPPHYFFNYLSVSLKELPIGTLMILFIVVSIYYQRNVQKNTSYLILSYFFPLLIIAMTAKYFRDRYVLLVFPIYIILATYGAKLFINFLFRPIKSKKIKLIRAASFVYFIVAIVLCLNFGYIFRIGFQASQENYYPAMLYIKKQMHEGDVIISANLPVAMIYLGKCDFIIRQKYEKGKWYGLLYKYDVRFGTPILGSLREVKNVFDTKKRIWYLALNNTVAGPDLKDYLVKHLELKFFDAPSQSAVYFYENRTGLP